MEMSVVDQPEKRIYRRGVYDTLWARVAAAPKGKGVEVAGLAAVDRRRLRAAAYARKRKRGIPYVVSEDREKGTVTVYIDEGSDAAQ